MTKKATYIEDYDNSAPIAVVFMDLRSKRRLVRGFWSPYLAEQFIRKIRHSKTAALVAYERYK